MDTITQTLESQILWQTPVKLIVTVAFYAFAAKLLSILIRRTLLSFIGFRWWLKGHSSRGELRPKDPGWTGVGGWLDKKGDEKHEQDLGAGKVPQDAQRRNIWSVLFGALVIAHAWLIREEG